MESVFPVLIVVACLAVLGVLFVGLFAMARGGEFNKKHGNRLMRARVLLQFVALGVLALAWLLTRG